MKADESYLARRKFLCGMLGGSATALGACVAGPLVRYTGNFRAEPPPDFVVLARAEHSIDPGTARMFMYGSVPVLLLRTPAPESVLRAFVAICTHFDCTVGYVPEKEAIFCACHEGYYDLEGRVTAGPPPLPLRKFHMRFRGDQLIIALEDDGLEKAFADDLG